MKIDLPQEARDHLNQEADKLLFLLKPEVKKNEPKQPPLSSSHHPVDHIITDEEVLNFGAFGSVDGFGQQKSNYFHTDKGFVGIAEGDYESFERLVDQIAQRRQIRQYLTRKYISEATFKWLEEMYKGLIPQSQSFIEYLSLKAESDIKDHKIGIPLSFIAIQEPFSVGRVTIDFCSTDFFDGIEKDLLERNPNHDSEGFKQLRKKYQGVVFSNITVCAEQERCLEIAVEETEKALMVLRFFSPSTFWPQIPSYFGRMGHANLPIGHYFIFEDRFPVVREQVEEKIDFRLTIDNEQLNMLRVAGLGVLSELISKDNLTDLEKLLLNSVSLFTKGVASKDHQDKIVFCLASIETLLLKNSTEPIQHTVGLRLAFITSRLPDERKKVISLVKNAYDVRSSYLHHGKRKQDLMMLTDLQHTIWTALRNAMSNRQRFSTQAQFLDFVENMILT